MDACFFWWTIGSGDGGSREKTDINIQERFTRGEDQDPKDQELKDRDEEEIDRTKPRGECGEIKKMGTASVYIGSMLPSSTQTEGELPSSGVRRQTERGSRLWGGARHRHGGARFNEVRKCPRGGGIKMA